MASRNTPKNAQTDYIKEVTLARQYDSQHGQHTHDEDMNIHHSRATDTKSLIFSTQSNIFSVH